MSRVLTAFAALGAALVAAQKFPARPIPKTLEDRVDAALAELQALAAEDPGALAFDPGAGSPGGPTFEERLAKVELTLFGDGDAEDGALQRLDDLEEAFTEAEDAAKAGEGQPSLQDQITALGGRLDAVEKAPPAAPAEPSVSEAAPPSGEGGSGKSKSKAADGGDAKLV